MALVGAKKVCYRYLAYSQGLPLGIMIFVLVFDKAGQTYNWMPKQYLPNMGAFGCFLGNGIIGQGKSYFINPVFIYFQSFMLVLYMNINESKSQVQA